MEQRNVEVVVEKNRIKLFFKMEKVSFFFRVDERLRMQFLNK